MRKVSHLGKKGDFPFVNLTASNIRRNTSKIFRSQRFKVVAADVMHLIRPQALNLAFQTWSRPLAGGWLAGALLQLHKQDVCM